MKRGCECQRQNHNLRLIAEKAVNEKGKSAAVTDFHSINRLYWRYGSEEMVF